MSHSVKTPWATYFGSPGTIIRLSVCMMIVPGKPKHVAYGVLTE
jgi:hypothetical protein